MSSHERGPYPASKREDLAKHEFRESHFVIIEKTILATSCLPSRRPEIS